MKLYKLTDKNDQTYGGCQWGENITHETSGEGGLCSSSFTHWYTSPLLAVLLNPIHGTFDLKTAHLWEGEGEIVKNDNGLKVGCRKAITKKRIPLPHVTLTQKVAFGILCALEVCTDSAFKNWAENWLSGKNRSRKDAANAAADYATAANAAAAYAAAASADYATAASAAYAAAYAAARAAYAAAYAAYDADYAADYAAYAADYAAYAADYATAASADYDADALFEKNKKIDLIAIAKSALKVK